MVYYGKLNSGKLFTKFFSNGKEPHNVQTHVKFLKV